MVQPSGDVRHDGNSRVLENSRVSGLVFEQVKKD